MDCKALYRGIQNNLLVNVDKTLSSDSFSRVANASAFIDDFRLWEQKIGNKYGDEIIKLAISEYETSILFCVQSLYKQAFTALRACLEHTMFGIQLTTNLYQYLRWKSNKQDVYWSQISDENTGLLSTDYVSIFFPELSPYSSVILQLAKRVYRECSEYTHGNFGAWKVLNEPELFDEKLVRRFFDTMDSVKYVIEFCFFVRFANEMPINDLQDLVPQIHEHLGHFCEVNEYLAHINEV